MFDKAGRHYAIAGISGVDHFCSHDCAKIRKPYATIQEVGPAQDNYSDLRKENH